LLTFASGTVAAIAVVATAYWPFNFEQSQWENQGILSGEPVHSVGECKPNVI
jgi:hypothetical protein